MKHPKVLLIDVDGTLTDSYPGIRASFLHALADNGIPAPNEDFTRRIPGPPMVETMQSLGLEGSLLDATLDSYLVHQRTVGWKQAAEFPGMKKLLAQWKAAGYVLSTATSKSESSAVRLLQHFGMLEYFDVIATASDDGSRRAKAEVVEFALQELQKLSREQGWAMPAPQQLLMVGDRIHDIEGARHYGIPVALVEWGYGSDEERAQADFVVATPEQLADLVR
ncbi:HAD hydrolase-like protein [Corynebacterium auriscanis]|uniref:HAD hydrolase-like protein n=1 Tax=Corynebacterium auriscanis TaxID=99807 RepID=UPI003CEAF9CC